MRLGVSRDRVLWELLLDELARVGVRSCHFTEKPCTSIHEDKLALIVWKRATPKTALLVKRGWMQEVVFPNHPACWTLTKTGAREACVALRGEIPA